VTWHGCVVFAHDPAHGCFIYDLMLLCPMNQVMAALSKPLLMLLCPIPAHGCFVRDLAFAALPMARLMAALSVIWVLLLYLWPGSWLLCP
jgi:hypothetical protein